MRKNRDCPCRNFCCDECQGCAHDEAYSTLRRKLERQKARFKPWNKAMKSAAGELLKLICKHPEFPIVPMANGKIVGDDTYAYWMGRWGHAIVDRYYIGAHRIFFYDESDMVDVLSEVMGWEWCENVNDEEALRKYRSLAWVDCIVVYIDPLQEEAAMAKQYSGNIADYEKKLGRVMERLSVTEFDFDYSSTRNDCKCWVNMCYQGRAYRFENSATKSAQCGRGLNCVSDLLGSIVYSLEGLARATEQGIFTLDMLLTGVPALPEAASVEPCFQALGFTRKPKTTAEIKERYRRTAKVMHPDAGGDADAFQALRANFEQCLELMEGGLDS